MVDDDGEKHDADDAPSLSELAARVSGEATSSDAADPDTAGRDGVEGRESAQGTPSLSDLADSIRTRSAPTQLTDPDDATEWDFIEGDDVGGADADPKTEAVLELAGDAANILLAGPSGCPAEQSLCSRLMASRSEKPVSVLVITVSETPSQRLSVLQSYLDAPVERTAVIDVRNYDRATDYDQYEGPVDIRTVSNPGDLRRIGIVASRILSEWDDDPGPTTVCFHSLSDLLALTGDRQRLFRFLHVLRGRVQSADARAHYHLDPTQHDDESVSTFTSLFDTVINFEEDGSVSLS
jgi:hypothetical protein